MFARQWEGCIFSLLGKHYCKWRWTTPARTGTKLIKTCTDIDIFMPYKLRSWCVKVNGKQWEGCGWQKGKGSLRYQPIIVRWQLQFWTRLTLCAWLIRHLGSHTVNVSMDATSSCLTFFTFIHRLFDYVTNH